MTAADDGTDWSLVNFAKQVFGAKSAAPEVGFNFVEPEPPKQETTPTPAEADHPAEAAKTAAPQDEPAGQPAEVTAEEPVKADEPAAAEIPETQAAIPSEPPFGVGESERPRRTAAEMADIIMNALRAVDGVPEKGFVITVYGSRPWNAMLTIKPEAGRVKDVTLWRQRVQDIGARLRRDFDLIDEP
jgi:hypothetical protein